MYGIARSIMRLRAPDIRTLHCRFLVLRSVITALKISLNGVIHLHTTRSPSYNSCRHFNQLKEAPSAVGPQDGTSVAAEAQKYISVVGPSLKELNL
jgi:hypothetical protein